MKINAVIPIRFTDCCHNNGDPKYVLKGDPLWVWTFRQAIESQALHRIIVAYDDKRFESHLEQWKKQLVGFLRPEFLSINEVSLYEVIAYVLKHDTDHLPDYVMSLEITHPLRPKGIIQQLVRTIKAQPVDSLFTVHPIHYNFWRKNEENSIERIQGSGDNSKIAMYQELTGICSIHTPSLLETENPFGEQIDMVPIERFWATIDVRDKDGLWLAERYLEKIHQEAGSLSEKQIKKL